MLNPLTTFAECAKVLETRSALVFHFRRLVLLLIIVIAVSVALRYAAERLASTPPHTARQLAPPREVEARDAAQPQRERRRRSQAAERPTSRGVIQVAPGR